MMMSSASNASASCMTVWPVTDAGTMIHAARGLVSFDAKSASDDEPVAPTSASSFTFGSLWSYTTQSWPSFMRRRTRPLPMRPSPIIPSCIAAPLSVSISRCVQGVRSANAVHASWSARLAHLLGLRADAGEQVVPRLDEGVRAFGLERRAQRVDADAGEHVLGIAAVRRQQIADGAVLAERQQRLLRHRVDGLQRRQRVDVKAV